MAAKYRDFKGSGSNEDEFLRTTLLKEGFGVVDISDAEIEKLKAHKNATDWVFADIISRRAQIGWSTHGHSGVDVCSPNVPQIPKSTNTSLQVNIYGSKGTERLHGNHENTDIGGKFIFTLPSRTTADKDLSSLPSGLPCTGPERRH